MAAVLRAEAGRNPYGRELRRELASRAHGAGTAARSGVWRGVQGWGWRDRADL